MRPRRLRLLAFILLPGCFACGGDGSAPPDSGASPVYGGTAVVAAPSDLAALNPFLATDRFSQEMNRFALYLPLVRYGPELEFEPALARSWEVLGDTGAIFHLRDDVYWHDGVRTTAWDVLFTWERAVEPGAALPISGYFEGWEVAEVVDSFTIRFRFHPIADALAGLPFTPIAPRHLLEPIPAAAMASAPLNRAPIGNGPFRFVEHRPNERWVFAANPDFPEELGGRPYLDRLVWRVIPDPTAEVTELQTGAVDLVLAVRAEDYHRLDEQPDVRGTVRESRQYAFVAWNARRAPLDDPRVRLALIMAIDREEMIEVLRAGYGQPAVGPIGPYHWGFAEDLGAPPFAPDSARALLVAAGLRDVNGDGLLERPDGSPLTLDLEYVATNGFQRDMAEMIRSDLAEVGIRITPTPLDWNTIIAGITSPGRDFDAVVMGWETDFRLNLRDTFHSAALAGPYQFAGYSNPEIDSLIDASTLLADRERAMPLLHRLQQIMRDEQPWGFLYYFPDLYVMRERLRGVHMDIRGTLVNLPEWWVIPPAAAPSDSADRGPSPGEEPSR